MKQISLNDIYDSKSVSEIRADASIGRRLSAAAETEITPHCLVQPIDIHLRFPGDKEMPMQGMTGYPLRSVDNAIAHIAEILQAGIKNVAIRLVAQTYEAKDRAAEKIGDPYKLLDDQAAAINRIRQYYPHADMHILADPFGLALNKDKTWGLQTGGRIDYFRTLEFMANIARSYAAAGVDSLLTIGRIEREVEAARKVIAREKLAMKVESFSTNLETKNAYLYIDGEPKSTDTGQKILVGSPTEMLLRALLDIEEGTSAVIVKPSENFHLMVSLKSLLINPGAVKKFLSSEKVALLLEHKQHLQTLKRDILNDLPGFVRRAGSVALGGYTVSGTYYQDQHAQARKGGYFMWELIHERFQNIAGSLAAWPAGAKIIDRNALWYLRNIPESGLTDTSNAEPLPAAYAANSI